MKELVSVRYRLKNLALMDVINAYKAKYADLMSVGKYYEEYFKVNHFHPTEYGKVDTIRALYTTDYAQMTHSLLGFTASNEHTSQVEIFAKDINTFKRGKNYQPLSKTKFNKHFTQDFTRTEVSFKPIMALVFGDDEATSFVFVPNDNGGGHMRGKALTSHYDKEALTFEVVIFEDDVTQHTRDNFEFVGYEETE